MLITRLELLNFGIYAGTNIFEFSCTKPIVLIGGLNGRGKTTFLDAVLLALYGPNSFAYKESRQSTYASYLKSYVNVSDGFGKAELRLEFKLEKDTEERYLVCREWSAGHHANEKVTVFKDGEFDDFLTKNWAMFIENVLPSGLSSFFFFDGEKIAEMAVEKTGDQMKESIKALLGINVLDSLGNDLSRLISRASRDADNDVDMTALEELKKRKEKAELEYDSKNADVDKLEAQIKSIEKDLEKRNAEYSAKGGDVIARRPDLYNQKNALVAKVEQQRNALLALATGELPLCMVRDTLVKIRKQAEKERAVKINRIAAEKIGKYMEGYLKDQGSVMGVSQIKLFMKYINDKAEEEYTEAVYNLSEDSIYRLGQLLDSQLAKTKAQVRFLMEERSKNLAKIETIENQLNIDIDERALNRLYKSIKELEQKKSDLEVERDAAIEARISLHGEAMRTSSEYNRNVESVLSRLEADKSNERFLLYANYAVNILNEYKVRLQKRKISNLAGTMTDCYKKLANKKNLIDRIDVDPVTLDFNYVGRDGGLVPKESLSAGEKQLMVIAMIWALSICSKKKLPVIVDTPLSRLDSNHRAALLTTYFPNASDQTIILSTDSEIAGEYYELIKVNVGDEFTLEYDDEKKCSRVCKGYFPGGLNGHQAD